MKKIELLTDGGMLIRFTALNSGKWAMSVGEIYCDDNDETRECIHHTTSGFYYYEIADIVKNYMEDYK